MRDFKTLSVWQKAHTLTLGVYRATGAYPNEERFGLVSQSRRAASSIAANIAEGCGRSGTADFAHFLTIARGSAGELEYHLLLARDLGWVDEAAYRELIAQTTEVLRMLSAFMQRLRS